MNSYAQVVFDVLEEARQAIQAQMVARGVNASGRTSASFHVEEVDGKSICLFGGGSDTAPVETLEIGAPPHVVPIRALISWVADKGLDVNPWAVQKKIAKEGTDRYINDGATPLRTHYDIYSTIATTYAEKASRMALASISKVIDTNF